MSLTMNELAEKARKMGDEHRLVIIQYVLLMAFVVIGVRLWSMQVIHYEEYAARAENNRLKTIPIPAPRGIIFDREGRVLVENHAALSIMMNREEMAAKGRSIMRTVDELRVRGLGLDEAYVTEHLDMLRRQPLWYPVVIKDNADPQDIAWVRAHQLEYPELDVVEQPVRRYPDGPLLAHILGYVGEVSAGQLEQPEYKDYKPGDVIGRAGIEKVYDRMLRGRDGMRRVVVDSTGREVGEVERIDPIPGRDLKLAVDLDLQRVAEEQLGERRGVIVAMDPGNGEILALVSHPSFDPNLFSQRIATTEGKAEYRALLKDPKNPLFNRAIQGNYPTGSTWKPLIAIAALEEGVISPEESRLPCGGGLQVGNRFVRCMGSHGMPNIHDAIRVSCDAYFYRLGLKLGVDRMHDWVKSMGLGQRTGIDLPNEKGGIIPGREIKARFNPKDPKWRDHDTVIASVGQGAVAVSPLQLLRAYAGIATGGVYHTPHLLLESGAPGPRTTYHGDQPLLVSFSQETHDMVVGGLWGVVNEAGTGGRARVVGFDVSGKTGTAQVVRLEKTTGEFRDHAWFVAFAPRQDPEIAVVVLVENVGFGGTYSAPIAGAMFEAHYQKHHAPVQEMQVAQGDSDEAPTLKLVEPSPLTPHGSTTSGNENRSRLPLEPLVEASGVDPVNQSPSSLPAERGNQAGGNPNAPPTPDSRRPRRVQPRQ